jgi:hypothetical protein
MWDAEIAAPRQGGARNDKGAWLAMTVVLGEYKKLTRGKRHCKIGDSLNQFYDNCEA